MKKDKKQPGEELDIPGLLALKAYEMPDESRVEKSIQNIMREVRTKGRHPSLLLFPDKRMGWMFAQPRYGIAALFVIFIGLQFLERPAQDPVQAGALQAVPVEEQMAAMGAAAPTNRMAGPVLAFPSAFAPGSYQSSNAYFADYSE